VRLLVATGMLPGHVIPYLEAIRALVLGGHQVVVHAEPYSLPLVRPTGATLLETSMTDATEVLLAAATTEERIAAALRFATAAAADLGQALARHRVEAALVDQMNLGGALACERWEGPWASFAVCPALLRPDFRDWPSMVPTASLRRELGLPPSTQNSLLMGLSPRRQLLPWIPMFDPAPLPPGARHLGLVYRQGSPRRAREAWREVFGPGPARRVMVSLSTSPQREQRARLARFVSVLLQVARRLPVQVLLTASTAVIPPDLSARVRALPFADHGLLLPAADVLVTHAGWGSLSRALAGGVPILAVPFERDQPFNARLCQAAHAGLAADPESADTVTVEAALRHLLDPPEPMRQALRVQREAWSSGYPGMAELMVELPRG
jgi:UDP:flavonoid glycosyltransferase YjiC (YdhE family)